MFTYDEKGNLCIKLSNFSSELGNLTTVEIQQLENIGDNIISASIWGQVANMGATTISAAQWGYLGALTTDPIGGDGTAGRILRKLMIKIEDGTNANTLKCTVTSRWNGDTIAVTDNIAKNATTGDFHLTVDGIELRIESTGLTGNCVMAIGSLIQNSSGTYYTGQCNMESNSIKMYVQAIDGGWGNLTAIVDVPGVLYFDILYITSA